jgi:hypothetical protein
VDEPEIAREMCGLIPLLQLNDHRHRVANIRPGITLAGYFQATVRTFGMSPFAIQSGRNNYSFLLELFAL